MRKEFSAAIEKAAAADPKVIFLTGDLGFMALENLQAAMGARFINAGVSEQNLVSMAAGLASQGYKILCYSIAPFAVFRPAEQIRIDVCLHDMDVKIIGNGGGYGYGIMGATHHAIEDIAVLSSFQNMKCYIPFCNEDVNGIVNVMMQRKGPSYLRMGFGIKPENLDLPAYNSVRKLKSGKKITVVGMGPVILNVLKALEMDGGMDIADLFAVSEMPLVELPESVLSSVAETGKVLVVEEHVSRGGLGENLSLLLLKKSIGCKLAHRFACGYPDGLYGSQAYHQKKSGLDPEALYKTIKELSNE
ncbi:MAG: transketolase C-terminal domain-containing protein [Victivallaceae bacterium]|jgi:transketolase